jgi:mannan endo-1,4-beta-mannosidase
MTQSTRRPFRPLVLFSLLFSLLVPPSALGDTLLGVYYGNQGWKMEQVRAMEAWQGKRHAVVVLFTDWCGQRKTMDNLFNQQLPNVWNNKNVPLITWEPYICSPAGTPADVEVRAAAGLYDAYLIAWADRLKVFLSGPDGVYGTADDRRAYIRPGHEMNGDWYPWGAAVGGNSPGDYVRMWRRVVDVFRGKGLGSTRVQWVWAVNHTDVGGALAEQYYPGDDYVDWVAIDGYNWGASQTWSSWQTPGQTYGPMSARLRTLTSKPLAITEGASTTSTASGANVGAKSGWVTEFFNYLLADDVRMAAWFNEDKETDWAVFGGASGDSTFKSGRTTYRAYAAYRAAVGFGGLIPSDANNLRLLTDAQFAGQ